MCFSHRWEICRIAASAILANLHFFAETSGFRGRVVGVTDGDTVTVLMDDVPKRIRLPGIDCPESRQAFGSRAKQFTADLSFGKNVVVNVQSID